jgi:DNA-binding response OmpR family regulator
VYTILLTEDDDELRDNLKRTLLLEGYKVLTANNGLNAYHYLLKQPADLIISDLHMPFINGLELLKIIKSNPRTGRIPFIFLTGDDDVQNLREGLSMGAKHFITKPFNLEFLLTIIKSVMEEMEKLYPLSIDENIK